ncbi:hypothetical protein D477_002181 [Arthrobacter crystallopoietes BAB-32]|uniref:Uncharacterized protein n=1 Tax=Arthrobacter crystallopoietes BAB-32 TaxID=1246476 RepID=N1V791_9MICC|nr:hypothetical protein [Arthrobacter crystallopoietes]EMY35854.1 hypothetical protein D477_002181 [Arthrobacter crystallopoietes BAB-32]
MSIKIDPAVPPRVQTRGFRSATVLFGVGALVAGLFSGPAAMAETDQSSPSPSPLISEPATAEVVNVSAPLITGEKLAAGGLVQSDGGQ